MTLPEGVNEDSIRARYENGVLEVTIEGAAAVREPRRIQIEGATSPAGAATDVGTRGARPESPTGLGAEGVRRDEPGVEGTRRPEGPGGTVR
jgi:hypothetical protein